MTKFIEGESVNVVMRDGEIKKAEYIGLFESIYTCKRTEREIGRHIHHTVKLNDEKWHFPLGTVFKEKIKEEWMLKLFANRFRCC